MPSHQAALDARTARGTHVAAPGVLVILGASGDLTTRLLMPAIYNLACDGLVAGNGSGLVGTDVGSTIENHNGTAWVSAAGGVTIPVGATGVLLRVSVVNDLLNETSEEVTIGTGPVTNVLNPAGVTGTITIKDDATGDMFGGSNSSGAPDAPGTGGLPLHADDDRPVAVSSSGDVNEKSAFAMFRVSGLEGQLVSLTLTGGSATLGTDFRNSLEYFDGSAWVPYAPPHQPQRHRVAAAERARAACGRKARGCQ